MKVLKKKGFTLAELLIVVAIIAVLIAIAIPVFTTQLEKSREATDLANVRSAYAQVMTAAISDDQSAVYDGSPIYKSEGVYQAVVPLKQKQEDWQSSKDLTIGGVSSTNAWQWKGHPMVDGNCEVTYYAYTDRAIFNWAGSSIITNVGFKESSWNNKRGRDGDHKEDIFSTYNPDKSKYAGLYELDKDTTYKVSFTYNPYLDDPTNPTKGIVGKATLLFDGNGKNYLDSGTGNFIMNKETVNKGVTYKYTTNKDGTITYTATFTTGNTTDKYYYGMNFGGMTITDYSTGTLDKNSHLNFITELGMTKEELTGVQNQIKNSFILEKVK